MAKHAGSLPARRKQKYFIASVLSVRVETYRKTKFSRQGRGEVSFNDKLRQGAQIGFTQGNIEKCTGQPMRHEYGIDDVSNTDRKARDLKSGNALET